MVHFAQSTQNIVDCKSKKWQKKGEKSCEWCECVCVCVCVCKTLMLPNWYCFSFCNLHSHHTIAWVNSSHRTTPHNTGIDLLCESFPVIITIKYMMRYANLWLLLTIVENNRIITCTFGFLSKNAIKMVQFESMTAASTWFVPEILNVLISLPKKNPSNFGESTYTSGQDIHSTRCIQSTILCHLHKMTF